MKKIESERRANAFVHRISNALVRFTPRTVEHDHSKTFDNLLYMDIQDDKNDITILFESVKEIDELIDKLESAKTRLRLDEIELGAGNKEVE